MDLLTTVARKTTNPDIAGKTSRYCILAVQKQAKAPETLSEFIDTSESYPDSSNDYPSICEG